MDTKYNKLIKILAGIIIVIMIVMSVNIPARFEKNIKNSIANPSEEPQSNFNGFLLYTNDDKSETYLVPSKNAKNTRPSYKFDNFYNQIFELSQNDYILFNSKDLSNGLIISVDYDKRDHAKILTIEEADEDIMSQIELANYVYIYDGFESLQRNPDEKLQSIQKIYEKNANHAYFSSEMLIRPLVEKIKIENMTYTLIDFQSVPFASKVE